MRVARRSLRAFGGALRGGQRSNVQIQLLSLIPQLVPNRSS